MSFFDFALRMFPYWALGGFTFYAIWKSEYKDLLSFDKKAFGKFFLFMLCINVARYFLLSTALRAGMAPGNLSAVNSLPIGATLFTPWEDLAHSVPLVLLRRMIGTSKWVMPLHWVLTGVVMVAFGMGHVYQGVGAAAFISLYILASMHYGKKVGFGTVGACHVLYDFSTILVVRAALAGL